MKKARKQCASKKAKKQAKNAGGKSAPVPPACKQAKKAGEKSVSSLAACNQAKKAASGPPACKQAKNAGGKSVSGSPTCKQAKKAGGKRGSSPQACNQAENAGGESAPGLPARKQAKKAREKSASSPPASVNGDKGTAATVPKQRRFRIVTTRKDGTVLVDVTRDFEDRKRHSFEGPVASSVTIYNNTDRLKFYTYVHHKCSAYGANHSGRMKGRLPVSIPIGGATINEKVGSFRFTAEDDNGPPPPRNAKRGDDKSHEWVPMSAVLNDSTSSPLVRQEQTRPFFRLVRVQKRRLFPVLDAMPMISKKQMRPSSLVATAPKMLEKETRSPLCRHRCQ